jgi:hypothetical protein
MIGWQCFNQNLQPARIGGAGFGIRARPEGVFILALVSEALEPKSGLWRDQFGPVPPYPIDAGALLSAIMPPRSVLNWPMRADQRPPPMINARISFFSNAPMLSRRYRPFKGRVPS